MRVRVELHRVITLNGPDRPAPSRSRIHVFVSEVKTITEGETMRQRSETPSTTSL